MEIATSHELERLAELATDTGERRRRAEHRSRGVAPRARLRSRARTRAANHPTRSETHPQQRLRNNAPHSERSHLELEKPSRRNSATHARRRVYNACAAPTKV